MLKGVIVTEWNTISSEETSKLIQSMPKRLKEVLRRVRVIQLAIKSLVDIPIKTVFPLGVGGCGSPVVKVSDHGRHVMSSSPVPLKTRRVGQRCTLNLSRVETSSRWCDVVARRGVPA
ncbi:uncharacterized protein TNCV_1854381 [Trichonephila clavipes]|nr:uncharacterized protein TNCV_1854381 [Trichonephila clavipes]